LDVSHRLAAIHGCALVHFVRDMLAHCRRDQRGPVSAALREVFNAEDHAQARERVGTCSSA
jgi:transposase-like protein